MFGLKPGKIHLPPDQRWWVTGRHHDGPSPLYLIPVFSVLVGWFWGVWGWGFFFGILSQQRPIFFHVSCTFGLPLIPPPPIFPHLCSQHPPKPGSPVGPLRSLPHSSTRSQGFSFQFLKSVVNLAFFSSFVFPFFLFFLKKKKIQISCFLSCRMKSGILWGIDAPKKHPPWDQRLTPLWAQELHKKSMKMSKNGKPLPSDVPPCSVLSVFFTWCSGQVVSAASC